MKNYLDALKRRKEETGESGFSLIELIVVVVILGILAAIAVPVFMGLQGQAETSAVETATANAASQVASDIASASSASPATLVSVNTSVDKLEKDGITLTVTSNGTFGVDTFCVTGAKGMTVTGVTSGPGCTSATP